MMSSTPTQSGKSIWLTRFRSLIAKARLGRYSALAVILQAASDAIEHGIENETAIVIRGFVDERMKRKASSGKSDDSGLEG